MAKKKAQGGKGGVDPLNVELPEEIKQALRELAAKNSRTLKAELMLALAAHLRAAGMMPGEEKV